ncbi:acyl-CoA thioesterase [Oryzicola mucosus]|uniref:Thioesterase n=1 Tax=Oryzicola mucosus TaxID=2767425 RepID=A0A8J6PZ20_9HYPH|nr:acyl-ACP thioesterase [Oryzicola mucosus]MBD0417002.1 thioesterase [Oryzicola mucosus]
MNDGTEVWRGGVNSWECDEMGHMNTRFYVARCMEGISVLFALAGLPGCFASGATVTAEVDEMHIRFHREAQAAAPLYLVAGFSRLGGHDAEIVALLRHDADGAVAATLRVALHACTPSGDAIAWPADFSRKAADLLMKVPPEARPRSVKAGPAPSFDGISALASHRRIALGSVGMADCDAFGRMLPQKFIGTVADGIRGLMAPLRALVAQHAEAVPQRFGGAVLEFRIVHLGQPRIGDCFEVRSAFTGADTKTLSVEHWMVDPVDGQVWGYMESVAVVFDLDRRKIVGITQTATDALRPLMLA